VTKRQYPLLGLFLVFLVGSADSSTIKMGRLGNGFQVYIHADEDLALTTVSMFFAAGRATDPDSLAGLAHLAEHLLTENSESYPNGGLARQSTLYSTYRNAYTRGGSIQFETQCLPEFLAKVLVLEVERLVLPRASVRGRSRRNTGNSRAHRTRGLRSFLPEIHSVSSGGIGHSGAGRS
jgi:predicted Zn-dependent peptidase